MPWKTFASCVLVLPFLSGLSFIHAQPGGAPREITGVVFLDRNANGLRDPGEPGLSAVSVSDQLQVVATGADGSFRIQSGRDRTLVNISVPDGHRCVGSFWKRTNSSASGPFDFGLAPLPRTTAFTFIHASDTHISEASLPRMALLRAVVDAEKPAFVLITGDLVRDALRVSEAEATGYYELFVRQIGRLSAPVWTVPGNHENFGIERDKSKVSADHPLYGRAMYRHFLGPDYYSFTYGGIHFVGLNSVDYDDQWYYGHVDDTQLAWLARDLSLVPVTTPIVTFNHIPFLSTGEVLRGYTEELPAPTLITVAGRTAYRHVVSNAPAILEQMKGRPYPLALGGHFHMRETIRYAADNSATRFDQTAAVVGLSETGALRMRSGVTVYGVRSGQIDEGRFVPLDGPIR